MTLFEEVTLIATKKLSDITDIDNDLLTMCIEEVEVFIKNYCNITTIPQELKFTWASMTEDLFRFNYAKTATSGDEVNAGDVYQIKMGDTTVNLDSSKTSSKHSKAASSHRANLDTLVMNYKAHLNRYRRMVW